MPIIIHDKTAEKVKKDEKFVCQDRMCGGVVYQKYGRFNPKCPKCGGQTTHEDEDE